MKITDDIYMVISEFLVKNDFQRANDKEKQELVEGAFKYYLSKKLKEVGLIDVTMETVNKLEIEELIKVLMWYLPKEEVALNLSLETETKKDIIAPFIFCLLKIMSRLQGYEIVWIVDSRTKGIRNPKIKNSNGFIESFNSNVNMNTLKVFSFLHKEFHENFIRIQYKKIMR